MCVCGAGGGRGGVRIWSSLHIWECRYRGKALPGPTGLYIATMAPAAC